MTILMSSTTNIPLDTTETGQRRGVATAQYFKQTDPDTGQSYHNLCWAACALMVEVMCNAANASTFEQIVQKVKGADCTSPSDCDKPAWPQDVYADLQIPFHQSGVLSYTAVSQDVSYNLPIQYYLAWSGTDYGHTALIAGFYDDGDVYILDPLYGQGAVKFETLLDAYGMGGFWTNSYNFFYRAE